MLPGSARWRPSNDTASHLDHHLRPLLAGACTTLTPDYERPAAPVPTSFPGVTADSEARAVADIAWRDYFADPRLRELIELALANNRDLRISTLNIEQARAQYRIQRADRFPAINAGIGETTTRTPGDLTSSGNATISRQYSANLGLSAWELDFFGRVRSLSEQALETYLGTEEATRAQLSLVAEVATAWLTLAADRELRDLRRTPSRHSRSPCR